MNLIKKIKETLARRKMKEKPDFQRFCFVCGRLTHGPRFKTCYRHIDPGIDYKKIAIDYAERKQKQEQKNEVQK